MILKRFLLILGAALVLEGAIFGLRYADLLYLGRPVTVIVSGPPTVFTRHATEALARTQLTRRQLDTIADAARTLQLHTLEVRALNRRAEDDPSDVATRLLLADALRRAGDYTRAERIYLGLLQSTSNEVR